MDASSREKLLEALKHSIPKKQIFENAPMSRYTTLRLGGPADVLVQIASVEQLSSAYAAARDAGAEVRVLGNGSNLLIRDGGVRGLVLQLGEWHLRHREAPRCKSCAMRQRTTLLAVWNLPAAFPARWAAQPI